MRNHSRNTSVEMLLQSQKVMTIATPCKNGVWSAPVYYLYKNSAFWFFSSPNSRHIIGSKSFSDMMVAASIFIDDSQFKNIRGIQMSGRIEETVKVWDISVVLDYIKKFGIPFNFKDSDVLTFFKQSYRAHFYRFIPSEIIYMDNSVYIGFKQKITL